MTHSPRKPDFICIGAMRCGTTTLWEMLRRQPGIFLPSTKELHFFDSDAWPDGRDQYLDHFIACPPGSICGEFTPSYMYIEEACDRIAQFNPDVRLIAVVRNPVDRAWSHYWLVVRQGMEVLGFEKALEVEADRLASGLIADRIHYSYFARGLYADQFERFGRRFGRDRLCILSMEELAATPGLVMARVLSHLGIPEGAVPPAGRDVHQNRGWHPRSRRARQAAVRMRAWAGTRGGLGCRGVRRLASVADRFNTAPGIPPIPAGVRQALMDRYAAADERLGAWMPGGVPWRQGSRS